MPDRPLLTVSNLTMQFGGITALSDVSFAVDTHAVTALIGPNGAGKTTVFNCLTGFYRATSGELTLRNGDRTIDIVRILGEPFRPTDFLNPWRFATRLFYKCFGGSHLVNRAGLARTFQNIRLFREMTVIENLLVAQHMSTNRNPVAGLLNTPGFRRSEKRVVSRACQWLEVFGLKDDANRIAGELPYGLQRRLEIARALCTNPQIICLDEPAAGLNPRETEDLSALIARLRDDHRITVFLIEHDMQLVMGISDHIVVLDHGVVIASGRPNDISTNPAVIAAYLGDTDTEAYTA